MSSATACRGQKRARKKGVHPADFALDDVVEITGKTLTHVLRQRGAKDSFCIDCHGIEAVLKFKYYHDMRVRDGDVNYLK